MLSVAKVASFASIIVMAAAPLTAAAAAPPPPPPPYVMDVAHLVTAGEGAGTITKLSDFVSDDVREYLNDKLVAEGKTSWLKYWSSGRFSPGRVLAYSPDWRDNGRLMVVDEYDMVDRSTLPPDFVADTRITSRATLFQFGPDHKIHVIRTILGGGFWIKP